MDKLTKELIKYQPDSNDTKEQAETKIAFREIYSDALNQSAGRDLDSAKFGSRYLGKDRNIQISTIRSKSYQRASHDLGEKSAFAEFTDNRLEKHPKGKVVDDENLSPTKKAAYLNRFNLLNQNPEISAREAHKLAKREVITPTKKPNGTSIPRGTPSPKISNNKNSQPNGSNKTSIKQRLGGLKTRLPKGVSSAKKRNNKNS